MLKLSFCPRNQLLSWFLSLGFAISISSQNFAQEAGTKLQESESRSAETAQDPLLEDEVDRSQEEDESDGSKVAVANEEVSDPSSPAATKKFNPAETFFGGVAPRTLEELRELEIKFAEITELVKPATVNIQMGGSQGSGVVVTRDGYILTAAHVIGEPFQKATVTFPDNRKFNATTLGNSTRDDSGILKIDDGQADEFPYIEMGISSNLKPGQWVLAIGHPGGIDEKRGLVVRAGRILNAAPNVLQTDCTLVGGDSGGPLVDLNGEVVGIHSRIGMNLWDNLHVPVDAYSDNWDRMIEGVMLAGRPSMGFSIAADSTKVETIKENGPAAKAGMQVGDVIKKIDGRTIANLDELKAVSRELLPNMKIKVVVQRGDQEMVLDLVVGRAGR